MKSKTPPKHSKTPPKTNIPGLAIESPKSKKKKSKKKREAAKLGRSDFLVTNKDEKVNEKDFVFEENVESSSDDEGKGFFKFSPMNPANFKSRTAKTIQKEELWNLSVHRAENVLKRPLDKSPDTDRRIRSRSLTLN